MSVQNLSATWAALDVRKKLIIAAATLVVFAALIALGRGRSPTMELLYSGLDPAAAGQVVAALEARSVAHDVRGGAIFVDQRDRDRLRMALAAEGMPAMGAKGYELLDELSGFGTTSQMFDAAYWRAKEGELARTIVSAPHIRTARVHISAATSRPFQRGVSGSAAVTVTTQSMPLTKDQALALQHLVSASVSNLGPEDVSIIDDLHGLISTADSAAAVGAGELGQELKARVERLLSARVGQGNAVVEVSVERVSEREVVTERRFDPDSRVAISAESEERSEESSGAGGSVTVASNLPDGDAAEAAGSGRKSTQVRERTNFEVSEVQREVERAPGDIKRLSVAVLLNHIRESGSDGSSELIPRSEEELAMLRALVASAVGLDEERGDALTIETMPFEPLPTEGTEAIAADGWAQPVDALQLAQLAAFSIVAIVLGVFVMRPLLIARGSAAGAEIAQLSPPPSVDDPAPLGLPQDTLAAPDELAPLPALEFGGFEPMASLEEDTPTAKLRTLIDERQDDALQILQGWLEEPARTDPGAA